MSTEHEDIWKKSFALTKEFYQKKWVSKGFLPGIDYVPKSDKVSDDQELIYLMDASLDFWLTAGKYTLEKRV